MRHEKSRDVLDIQAEGLNLINKYCKDLLQHVVPVLKTFVSEKIGTIKDEATAKFANAIKIPTVPAIQEDEKHVSFMCYFSGFCKGSLWLNTKICISGGKYENKTAYCQYFEKSMYLGDVNNMVLESAIDIEKIEENATLNESYTTEGLAQAVAAFKKAKDEMDTAWRKIPDSVRQAKYLSKG
jgi:hypothetical protein